jgi:hypothetical protein
MKTFDFEVVLTDGVEMTEELANRLFETGCDDGLPGMSCGIACISFSRQADSLESAIRSAIADVQRAGCTVKRVQIECDSPLLAGVQ